MTRARVPWLLAGARARPGGDLPLPALLDVCDQPEGRVRRSSPARRPSGRMTSSPASTETSGRGGPCRPSCGTRLVIASGVTALTVLLGTGCAYVLARYRTRLDRRRPLRDPDASGPAGLGDDHAALRRLQPARAARIPADCRDPGHGSQGDALLHRAGAGDLHERPARTRGGRAGGRQFPLGRVPLHRSAARPERHPRARHPDLHDCRSASTSTRSRSSRSRSYQPASVGLSGFLGPNSTDWNGIMAYAAIYVTPILAFFVILQRRIVAGLTSGALK